MLDPDRYFPQEKKPPSRIKSGRPGQAFGFTHLLGLRVSVKRLDGGCLLYTLADRRPLGVRLPDE